MQFDYKVSHGKVTLRQKLHLILEMGLRTKINMSSNLILLLFDSSQWPARSVTGDVPYINVREAASVGFICIFTVFSCFNNQFSMVS